MNTKYEYKGDCPICDRKMYDDGFSINKHHFKPKCKGGKETTYVHTICHNKIHSLFTEAECAKNYSDPELVKAHPDMQTFIKWIKNKDSFFYVKTKQSNNKRK